MRSLQYRVPSTAAAAAGRPLVIYLHGNGGTSAIPAAYAPHTDLQGAILASLQGLSPSGVSNWEFRMDGKFPATAAGAAPASGNDDVEFIKQVIDRAVSTASPLFGAGQAVDPTKVFVVGESRGAGMAFVAYADPRTKNKIRAIAPISGTFFCDIQTPNSGLVLPPVDADANCGEVSAFGFYGPKDQLFARNTDARILGIWGKVTNGEFSSTQLEATFGNQFNSSLGLWANKGTNVCERNINPANGVVINPINGTPSTTVGYRQRTAAGSAAPCTADITYLLDQTQGHVPGGYSERIIKWFFGQYSPLP